MPPRQRIIAILAAYNEADVISHTLGDLVAQDIEVYLLDHGSTDGTVEAAQAFLGRGLLRIEPFGANPQASPSRSDRFALAAIIARKEELARELQADWFINHDADEFRESPWSHLNLRQGIELVDRLDFNAIDFEVLNFWPTHDRYSPGSDVREAFQHFAYGEPWDRLQIRCWKNTGRPTELVETAGHEARFEGRRVFPLRFLLRHYPIRGQAHGARKVFEERLPRFAAEERTRGWHVQYDDLPKDHCFIRDPSSLRVYDPEAVRVELQLRHRGLEELEETSRQLRERLDEATRGLSAEHDRVRVLQEAVQQHAATVNQMRTDAERTARRVDEQTRQITELNQLLQRQRLETEQQQRDHTAAQHGLHARVLELDGRLAAVYASASWRVTAPLRAVGRLLTGR